MDVPRGRRRQIVLWTGTLIIWCVLSANAPWLLARFCKENPIVHVHKHTMEKEWVRNAVSARNVTDVRVLVMQTCGHGKYEPLLRTTRIANERWAAKHGYDYLSVTGVYEGGREWLSTFNKGFMIAEAMNTSKYDLVFYMDSDAMVTNDAWDVRALPEVRGVMLAAHPGSNFGPWDINAGIMLWDLRNPLAAAIIGEWTKRCSRALKDGGEGDPGTDDQALLHHTLRDHLLGVGFNGTDGTRAGRGAAAALGVVAVLPSRGSVQHYLRPVATDWTGDSVTGRLKDARKDLANIKF